MPRRRSQAVAQRKSRTTRRTQRKTTAAVRVPRWQGPAPLLAVDQTPYLKEAVTRCKRTIAKVNRCRKEIEAFSAEDRPAFEGWSAREFGPLLTSLRETGQALGENASLADHLQWAIHVRGVPMEEAYEYIMRRRADPEYRHPVYDAGEDEERGGNSDPDSSFDGDEEESEENAFFRRFFEEFYGNGFGGDEDEEEADEDEWERVAGRTRKTSSPPTHIASELKKLFRRLARRLHPDGDGGSALDRERWEEAYEAYRRGDIETLRTLDTVCEVEGIPVSKKLGLARLEAVRRHHESRFRVLSEERRELKHDPAWGFSRMKPDKIRALRRKTEFKLRMKLEDMEEELSAAEAFIGNLRELGVHEATRQQQQEEDLARRKAFEAKRREENFRRNAARKAAKRSREAAAAAAAGQTEFAF